MQTADGAFAGAKAHIGLQGGEVDCMFSELTAAPRAQEPASCVYMRRRLDDPRANDTTFAEIHFIQLVRPPSDIDDPSSIDSQLRFSEESRGHQHGSTLTRPVTASAAFLSRRQQMRRDPPCIDNSSTLKSVMPWYAAIGHDKSAICTTSTMADHATTVIWLF